MQSINFNRHSTTLDSSIGAAEAHPGLFSILWWAEWTAQLAGLHFNHPHTSIEPTYLTGTHIRFRKPGFSINLIFLSVTSMLTIQTFKHNYSIYRFKLIGACNMILTTTNRL